MASLPPRKSSTPSKGTKQSLSSLDVLLQMGFPQNRAEKALAATGDRGVQLASDWLLAHVNDPHIDEGDTRDFYLYMCPTGALLQQLTQFRRRVLTQCGRNGAHSLLPHVTLAAPFKVTHRQVGLLVDTLERTAGRCLAQLPDRWRLERYVSQNYMGLFIEEAQADVLKKMTAQLARELARHNIKLEAQTKSLHLTLAYQFSAAHFVQLEELLTLVDPTSACLWELRLYSRDPRLEGREVHKVLYAHVPREPDELELVVGDYVYVSRDSLQNSPDGWVEATSWLTGQSGFLPHNYIQPMAESDSWTLHRALPMSRSALSEELDGPPCRRQPLQHASSQERLRQSLSSLGSDTSLQETAERPRSVYDNVLVTDDPPAQAERPAARPAPLAASVDSSAPRQVWVARHGERVDFTYGSWIPFCFDEGGNYVQKDLNMPVTLRTRSDGPKGFAKDSPVTQVGRVQARLTGEAMKRHNVQVHHVYCSPSLRCVETAYFILAGMGMQHQLPLRIEPGLFEWLVWYSDGLPSFLSVSELQSWGFNVDAGYRPLVTVEELRDRKESCEQYYQRNHFVTQHALRTAASGNILLVGHAATLDTCTRQQTGHQPRSAVELRAFLGKIPYCSILAMEETSGGWELKDALFPPLTHSYNQRLDLALLK
ncbi:protein UBASH3A homolog [Pollicipes pollicipes]|uniref:protein UBASH3A homolog n=1 Tax=Pollicipes pollicipes TaxID=41117 RepID=UPI0018851DF3|nr:protein UBASH3A homolog [Pollicipes pollicipes]XP_037086327.1 protein UBASH3A homolog [Pollicipes pollicipes]XP_037086335.1 protein UBASH3A homolog [Pollicipes pollicipes]XP_037086340.1 protein UBASH3A homolog [Pollicipes pollicipes]XP_037086349.1 protein UBASH3A homolog [Pollicipes pollicipes]